MMNEEIYRNWKQSMPELNELEAWPAEIFPEADYHYFKEAGCLVTSLAIMLVRFGIEKEEDEELYNPWVLNQKLIESGCFDSGANLHLDRINCLYQMDYIGSLSYSREKLIQLCESGEPFLITVPGIRGERHFIVPDKLTEDDLMIIDAAWGKTRLSEFEIICELRVFKNRL